LGVFCEFWHPQLQFLTKKNHNELVKWGKKKWKMDTLNWEFFKFNRVFANVIKVKWGKVEFSLNKLCSIIVGNCFVDIID
jgi:hypothetical protein